MAAGSVGLDRYFSDGGPDTPISTAWRDGVECWTAPASDIRELIAVEAKLEEAFGFAWSALRSIVDDKCAPVAVQLNAQRAMDNLRTLYPTATEGLEA